MKFQTTNSCKFLAVSAFGILSLTACGDDVTKTTLNETSGMGLLADGKAFPECTTENAGEMLFAADSGKIYYCSDSSWQTLNGNDGSAGSSCIAESLKDSSGYTIICAGDTVGTLKNGAAGADGKDGTDGTDGKDGADGKNGADGTDGTNGKDGEDGTNCTAEALDNGTGYTLTCGGKVVGTLKNGIDGTNGKNGSDGTSCTAKANSTGFDLICGGETVASIVNGKNGADGTGCTIADADGAESGIYKITCGEKTVTVKDGAAGSDGTGCTLTDNGDGTVTVTCGENESKTTLYKALCGTEAYDPSAKFCNNDKLYDLCGSKSYSPLKYTCEDGTLKEVKLCGTETYDPETQICSAGSILDIAEVTTAYLNADMLKSGAYGTFIDTRDGQLYRTIEINGQTWMAQNLNYDYNKGSAASYCYDNTEANYETYGRLYTWDAAKTVCPTGWHLPDTTEFRKLITTAENSSAALKTTSGWNKSGNGNDTYGFSALPAGRRDKSSSTFLAAGEYANFWSATQWYTYDLAYKMHFYYGNTTAVIANASMAEAYSIRCLKDSD